MADKKQQINFLNSLYAIYANSAGKFKQLSKEITTAIKNNDAINIWKQVAAATPKEDIRGILMQVSQGKNVELKPLGVALKRYLLAGASEELAPPVIELATRFSGYFRTGSEVGARSVARASGSAVFPDWIRTSFQAKHIDQRKVGTSLQDFVKSITGKPGTGLTVDQANKLKAKDREKYKEYLKLRRDFQLSWKNAASNYVRENGNPLVDMEDLLAFLDEQGLEYSLPSGFTGKVDSELRWYDSNGELIGGVPTAHMFPTVRMNEDRQPGEYVFTAIPGASGSKEKYFYIVREIRERRDRKFKTVQNVVPIIHHARKIWIDGIRRFDINDDKTVAAVAIELSYQFASRIGTEGNQTKGKTTYGLTTTLVRHLKFVTNGFTLTYPGKDGVKNSHKFVATDAESRLVLDAVKKLVDGKEPDDLIFTVGEESRRPLRPVVVNAVFRKLIGTKDLSIHKMRTLRGTVIFQEGVDAFIKQNKGAELTEKEAMAQLRKMALEVGKQLNHIRTSADGEEKVTPETALRSYIDPSVQIRFFEALGLPTPKYLLKMSGKDRLESRVLADALVVAEPAEEGTESVEDLEADLGDDAFVAEPSDGEEPSGDDVAEPEAPAEEGDPDVAEPESEPESESEPVPEEEEAPEGKKEKKQDKEVVDPESKEEKPAKPPEEMEKERISKERKKAEQSAPEDSRLLRSILIEPDLAQEN